jgi:NAD/NADP transhydrogenase beta subunit
VTATEPRSSSAAVGSPRAARPATDAAAALSGLAWAALAYLFGRDPLGEAIWGGIVAAPLIGILVGRLFHPFEHPKPHHLFWALSSLYVAVGLFGLAAGMADWMWNEYPERNGPALVVQMFLGCVWGVTFTGLVVVFWPLCVLNHWLLRRIGGS